MVRARFCHTTTLPEALLLEVVRDLVIDREMLVREGGLEPPRPETLEPKSSASANSATRASARQVYNAVVGVPASA